MFHVKHGQFFTILNYPFTFANCQMHPVKYYGGNFAKVYSGNTLIISVLRQFCAGAFGSLFSPAARPVALASLVACRPGLRPSLMPPSFRLGSAALRRSLSPSVMPPSLVRRPSRPAAAFGRGPVPLRCIASGAASRSLRFRSAHRGRGPLFAAFSCGIVQNVIYLCPVCNL